MNVSSFIIANGSDFAVAIREIAGSLFNLTEVELECDGNTLEQCLPANTVFIRCCVLDGTQAVETEVFYRKETGDIERLVRRQASDQELKIQPVEGVFSRLAKLNTLKILMTLTGNSPGPWGILRGVRPTKIVHRLLDRGMTRSVIIDRLKDQYGIDRDKAELVTKIALRQRKFLPSGPEFSRTVSIYVGIPFCPSRCLYCSFPAFSLPGCADQIDDFLAALAADIKAAADIIRRRNLQVQTIYIGGGTPTSLAAPHFERLMELVAGHLLQAGTVEFTVEAGRPDSINDEKIHAMLKSGVNRVSINPQTMQQKTLNLIGRRHTVQDIIEVFGKFRALNFPVINMDVIAGLPGETAGDMADTMERIAALKPDNLTVHTLAIKKGSLLKLQTASINIPDEKTVKAMLEIARDYADKLGMSPYYLYRQKYMTGNFENIGYAGEGKECLYNIQIMEERQTIIGIGPAAGTKVVSPKDWRLASTYNPKDVGTYIINVRENARKRQRLLDQQFS